MRYFPADGFIGTITPMKYCIECNAPKSRKGEYCKSCSYKHRTRPSGLKYNLVKENPTSFKKGHTPWHKGTIGLVTAWNKGTEGLMKPNSGSFKGGDVPWNRGKAHLADEKHPLWVGDTVGYNALHSWVQRKLGKKQLCENCGTVNSKRFDWHNTDGKYTRDLSTWHRLCVTCHNNVHKNWDKK